MIGDYAILTIECKQSAELFLQKQLLIWAADSPYRQNNDPF